MEKILRFIEKYIIPKFLYRRLQPPYHFLLVFLGAFIYGFPSGKMIVIGVTGTKGKSTTVYFLSKIFEAAGYKIAALSSIQFKIADEVWINKLKMTMPGRFHIQKFLAKAQKAGCRFAIIEVTSQGVVQSRHKFINFDSAVFTNLAPEHIESHGSFENYKQAKLKFFKNVKNGHIINKDDKYFEEFWNISAKNKIAYSLEDVKGLKLQIAGNFNLSNAAAAIKTAEIYGVENEVSKKTLSEIKSIPGRMEFIEEGQNFQIIIDYAHTPDSLLNVYKTLQGNQRRLICVFGAAGGGRDKWKRPAMGKIAAQYCDEIILTNEDPYDENPNQILSDIKSGISDFQFSISNLYEIVDRREAIEKALSLAKKDDIVILTGKGSESSMCVESGKKIPWDEGKIVEEILNQQIMN
ncbi:MAG: UDP-N-acetylmuramoyl-L-alanyl-D-glutamate-2,6-diaminopimelate ligase [Candidatus Wolfebacteria bacterium GW2011_GWA2_42_10]|uniref:UDP-N-acetylmuramoyl-L-alanyl-D-glutamate-2, 6-diaminopimelate ligase n=2 Tax=Candidatus Wolfeibacteriota TaxID=1752735 RepID=A0A0G0XLJ2_9BACT|nr:MAG: UDP-N-acetylmuramoyl-L-alanyl-D-glutamate-2,6-diaminopimelate ligase [Candidatus Wolfebacteria bacterium GW2011_GWB1_41_12]KKS25327.1 MAG: UDP-N-acetylmuramoyl-L-alanyl-D-glutamate-2,6-diaminopimelate ligase [Candidatus Wolfebacteria bacterium GW2011_GWA2_42_10]KKT56766.1 MAG: UDP-N-acetylmuramoyl-L-alanyl-D-glutamate-2,6-diaminopimelate ligase [Candidatus Wolfebacteria bacterium GW2011_GWA1_44_24]